MKPEYDFSKAERGKFYRPNAETRFPVYLEPDIDASLTRLAQDGQVDVQDLVNELLRADLELLQSRP